MKKKVLIIDDDTVMVSICKYALGRTNFEVYAETSALNGMRMLLTIRPDLIILDLMMPQIAGIDIIKEVRQRLKQNTPILVISSTDDESQILEALNSGATDFLAKPFTPSELIIRSNKCYERV